MFQAWRLLYVRLFLCLCLAGLCLKTNAILGQKKTRGRSINLQYYDDHFIHYGMILGLHTTRYSLLYNDAFSGRGYQDLHSIQVRNSPGFKVGFVFNFRITNNIDLRFLPSYGLYENRLEYRKTDGTQETQLIDFALVEFPILVKLKSKRFFNSRVYLIGGVSPAIDASTQDDEEAENKSIVIKKSFTSLEAGVGFDFYMSFFKLSPEIRYSYAFSNVIGTGDNYFQNAIQSLRPHTISLFIIFEGGAY